MVQRMDGGHGLSSPPRPHAEIFVCNSLVPGVDELSSTDTFPVPSYPPGGGHDETISDHTVRYSCSRLRLAVCRLHINKLNHFGFCT